MFPSPAYFDPSMAAAISVIAPEMLATAEVTAFPFQTLEQFDYISSLESTAIPSLAYSWQEMTSLVFNAHLSMRYPVTAATSASPSNILNAANLSSALIVPAELSTISTASSSEHCENSAKNNHVSESFL